MQRLERVWEAAATLLWMLPLLGFLLLHGHTAPPPLAQLVVGTLALLGLAAPRALPPRWFAVRRWEADSAVYRALGVRRFGRWVPRGAVMNRVARRRAARLSRAGAPPRFGAAAAAHGALAAATRDSERTHCGWLLLTGAVTVWAAAIGAWPSALVLLIVNVAVNAYPVMLQRDSRARLQRLARRRAPAAENPEHRACARPTSVRTTR